MDCAGTDSFCLGSSGHRGSSAFDFACCDIYHRTVNAFSFVICLLQYLLFALLLLQFPATTVNMIGTTVTEVTPIQIGDEYLNSFIMTVLSANETAPLNENITVVMSTILSPPALGSRVNVTGTWDELAQVFRADSVQVIVGTDWFALIREALGMIAGIMAGIASVVASLIAMATGYSVQPWLITVILEALFVFGIIKWYKSIGLILLLAVIFLAVSGGVTLTSFMWH